MARILAVDDDDSVRDFYRLALGALGHEVTVSGDPEDALRKVRAGRYDLVLLDILLPGGYEVLEKLRDAGTPPPVIVVSGADDPEGIFRELEGGALDHVAKPVSFEDLARAVTTVLSDPGEMDRRRLALLEEARSHGSLVHLFDGERARRQRPSRAGNGKVVAIDGARPRREQGARVLVVDDEPTIRALMEAIVRLMGHHPIGAADGEEALALLEKKRFDLVVLDIMMPRVDGYEVLRRMRELPACAQTPVIVVTAKHDPQGILRELDMGAVDHLPKPYRTEELQIAVERALGSRLESEERKKALATTARTYGDMSSLWSAARDDEDPYQPQRRRLTRR